MQQGDREPSISELINQLKQVRIQEARIIAQIERVSRQGPAEQFVDYQVGDRVRVTNGVKGTRATTGTVTKVGDERIGIELDDGTRTWRIRKNLERW